MNRWEQLVVVSHNKKMISNQLLKRKIFPNSGFTFIELILYVLLVSIFVTGAIFFAWDIVYGREKAYQQQIVEQNAKRAIARIGYEISRAKNIQSVSVNQLILDNGGSTTTIGLSSGVIQLTTGVTGPFNLTSDEVQVTDLVFSNLTSADNNAKNIKVSITVRQAATILSGQVPAQTIMSQSAELNSQFNQARSLLMDTTNVVLASGDKRLEGTTLQNSGSGDITIDKIMVSWRGGTTGSRLNDIVFNGVTVWSGSASSGDLLDITNTILTSGTVAIPVDRFGFSHSMKDSTIIITYFMTDNSSVIVQLTFEPLTPTPSSGPTVTPTPTTGPTTVPTSTPTPTPSSCNQHCQQKYSLPGSCVKSNQCSGYDEGRIYECTSPNICCCQ